MSGVNDPSSDPCNVEQIIAWAREMVVPGERRILGITGAPGSGKSTLGETLAAALDGQAVLAGLDSFHLSNAELHRLGRRERKGAADTFDAAGYVNLLRRLRAREEAVVYAAVFDRNLEESIACALPIPQEVPLIITEGNYLLVREPEWAPVGELLDECWYVDPGEGTRLERLIARHEYFGRSPAKASERSHGSDQRNALLVAATRRYADRVIECPGLSPVGDR